MKIMFMNPMICTTNTIAYNLPRVVKICVPENFLFTAKLRVLLSRFDPLIIFLSNSILKWRLTIHYRKTEFKLKLCSLVYCQAQTQLRPQLYCTASLAK